MPANNVSDTANATVAPPTVTITISGETYSDGYKSGAVVTGTCDGPGGITAFSFEDNTGDTGTLTTDTTTKKVNNITLSSANANRQVTISCTANGLTSTKTETYKIYVYGSSSVCGSATYSGSCHCNDGSSAVCTAYILQQYGSCSAFCSTRGTSFLNGSCTSSYPSCWHT